MTYRINLRDRVAVVTPDRPERKNPPTFDRYAALRNGFGGLLEVSVPDGSPLSVRSLCLSRTIMGRHAGLGTGAVTLFGTPKQKQRWLPPMRSGTALAAFALSEAMAGSGVAALVEPRAIVEIDALAILAH